MFYKKRFAGKPRKQRKAIIKRKLYNRYKMTNFKKNVLSIMKTEIAKNVENKVSSNWDPSGNVAIYSGGGPHVFDWLVFNTWETNLFNISQGTGQGDRIGNRIKLKRWVSKLSH